MHILHVDTGAEMRGGQFQALLLMKALRDAGHECTVLAREHSPLWRAGIGEGFTTEAARYGSVWKYSRKADIVHAHDAHAHTLSAVAGRKPLVVSRRVAFPVGAGAGSRWKYRRAKRYLAVSKFVAGQLTAAGIPEEKIDVVYDAVAPAVIPERRWNPELPAVTLNSDDPQKGRDLVEAATRQSGIEVVYSDNLPHDLQSASMLVYVSRSEGLGSAALLAMQAGVPVIAGAVEGLREVFEDGVSGIYVNNDVNEIVRAMRRLLGNRSLAEKLIAGGKERVRACFSVERLVQQTVDSYQKALHA